VSNWADSENVNWFCRPTIGVTLEAGQTLTGDAFDVGSLAFRCPMTQAEIKSGIDLDSRTFRQIRQFRIQVCCSECMNVHAFMVGRGVIAPYEPTASFRCIKTEIVERLGNVVTPVIHGPRGKSSWKRTWS
jgi:hypothetical protein